MAGEIEQPGFAEVKQRGGNGAQAFAVLAPAVQPYQPQRAVGLGKRLGAKGGARKLEGCGLWHTCIDSRKPQMETRNYAG